MAKQRRWTEEDVKRLINKRQGQPAIPIPEPKTSLERFQALGRMQAGRENKTESEYGAYLENLKAAGEVLWYKFEPVNIRLAKRTYYRVDYMVLRSDRTIDMVDVKGFWTDDAKAKIKIAAETLPIFRFVAAYKKGGGWEHEYF